MPIIKLDYIKDKLSYIQSKINNDTKLQHYDINKKAEDIFMHLLNLTYGWNLQNVNDEVINFPAIDLMDTTKNNEIVIQITSDTKKKKVKEDTVDAFNTLVKKDKYKIYAHYEIKMFYIKDKPSKSTLKNWEDEGLISQSNILGIEDINKKISADTTHTLATKVYRYLCNYFDDKACDSDLSPQLTTKLGKSTLIGREKELQEIDERLKASNTLLVKGIGGVGKSTIASNYLHRHKDEYDYYGFFEGLESFEIELEGAFKLEIEQGQDRLDRVLRELIKLEPTSNKLLVIDDVKDIKENQEKLEKILGLEHNGYRVLLTSRFKVKNVNIYPLLTLDPQDAQKLFLDNYKTDELEKVNKITEYLDYHPLFVELVAKTIDNEGYSLDEIIEKFELRELAKIEFIDDNGDEVLFNQNLQELFEMQKENLTDEYLLLLKQLAVLPSIDIELSFLEELLQENRLEGKLKFLVSNGWLIENKKYYKLHQLIKEYILFNQFPLFYEVENIFFYFYKIIEKISQQTVRKHQNHLIYLDSIYSYLMITSNNKIYMLSYIADVFNFKFLNRMIFSLNFRIDIDNLNISNKRNRLNKVHNQIFFFMEKIATVYEFQGNYQKSLTLYNNVVNMHKVFVGESHFTMSSKYHNLGRIYRVQYDYENALFYFKKSVKITEKKLGEKHLKTANHYNSLGVLYELMEKYDESELFYLKSLKIETICLDKNHTSIANTYYNLAVLYKAKGKYEKVEEYFLKSIKINEKIWGKNSYNTTYSYNALAEFYKSIKKYEEAEFLYMKSLDIIKVVLGDNHPNTALFYNNLASFYQVQGEFDKANNLFKKSLEILEKIVDENHPDMARSYNNLAWTSNDIFEAYNYMQKAVNILEKNSISHHRKLLISKKNLEKIRLKINEKNMSDDNNSII
jgi:tetratricopeptide (TPR) repeat protein